MNNKCTWKFVKFLWKYNFSCNQGPLIDSTLYWRQKIFSPYAEMQNIVRIG